MKRFTTIWIVMVVVGLLLVVGCGKAKGPAGVKEQVGIKKGGTVVFGGARTVTSLNPFIGTTSINQYVRELAYENLLILDETEGNILPNLAKKWDISSDAKEYTFYLEEGVKFHNGQELTADDVVWTIKYVQNPENGASGNNTIKSIKSAEAVNKYTVKITLSQPFPAFLATLAQIRSMTIVPAGSVQDGVRTKQATAPPGTGAFKIVNFVPEQEVVLERFADFWKGAAYLDRVIYRTMLDEEIRFAALRAGDADIIERVPLPQLQRITKGEIQGVNTHEALISGFRRLVFNTRKPPFDNVKMRLAVAYGFDKEEFLEEAFWGYGVTADIKMPPGSKWDIDLPKRGPDLAKANQLLKEAGYNNEEIILLVEKGLDEMTEAVERQLRKTGLNVKVAVFESGIYQEGQAKGEFDIAVRGGSTGADPSPPLRPEYFSEKGDVRAANFAGWNDPKTDELFVKMDSMIDPDKRFELYKELTIHLHDQIPYLNLVYHSRHFGSAAYVKDFVPSAGGSYIHANGGLSRTWLDK